MTEEMRMESDSIGTMEVPKEAYYGVQALRAKQNFRLQDRVCILYLSATLQK